MSETGISGFACPGWPLYTPEGRRAHETLFVAESPSSRGRSRHRRRSASKRWNSSSRSRHGSSKPIPKLSDAEGLSKACELPAGQWCAAIERQASLQGVPFEVEEVEPLDTSVLSGPEIEVEKRVNAMLAKADTLLTREQAVSKVLAEDPTLYASYRSTVTLGRDGRPLALR